MLHFKILCKVPLNKDMFNNISSSTNLMKKKAISEKSYYKHYTSIHFIPTLVASTFVYFMKYASHSSM